MRLGTSHCLFAVINLTTYLTVNPVCLSTCFPFGWIFIPGCPAMYLISPCLFAAIKLSVFPSVYRFSLCFHLSVSAFRHVTPLCLFVVINLPVSPSVWRYSFILMSDYLSHVTSLPLSLFCHQPISVFPSVCLSVFLVLICLSIDFPCFNLSVHICPAFPGAAGSGGTEGSAGC